VSVTIPPDHRRILSVTAHILEDSMEELERVLRSQDANRVTRHIAPVYSEPERRALLEKIAQVRSANAEMFASLELQATVTMEDQLIRGRLSHVWVILQDSLSRSMKGYGKLPAHVAAKIDGQVRPILEIVEHLIALAGRANRDEKDSL
jgi:hypothetical protein